MKIIIFNGPPGSGKDECVNHLKSKGTIFPFSFKTRLKAITLAIYNIPEKTWNGWYTREGKELKRPELMGRSQREALIHTSETVIKPVFGVEYFGESEAQNIIQNATEKYYVAACSDGGFNSEILPLVDNFGSDNVYVVRIHREGYTFAGDSRNWIDLEEVPNENYIHIYNNGTLEDLKDEVDQILDFIVNGDKENV